MHSMVDSKKHYLLDMIFDPGKDYKNIINNDDSISYSMVIVNKLVDKLPNKGSIFFLIFGILQLNY